MFGDLGLRPEMLVDLAINLANIVIMFLIVRFLVYKPVRKFMNARAQKAENEKKETDAKLEEARQLKEEYTQKLQQTEEAAKKLIADANAEAENSAAVILNKARSDAGAIIEEAKREAQHTAEEISKQMRGQVVELAIDIAQRLIERNVNDADNMRYAQELFSQLDQESKG